ncbi:hypothetical protein BU23DRAFT_559780 [Bimuria novae-zelandiae CBS 107.79]|uniref:Uncharacterized protein n=1 Tax=Bimuria novae-zelandiae CBS 107.79 TaxID=1447943 RepID=A0A6A5UQK3_9PLEO|nr:hypothetical protein BU23DRAFT_559780 [Bimuria novae-zelandiae CBS 107.79]
MCFGAFFGSSSQKHRNTQPDPRRKKRKERPDALHYEKASSEVKTPERRSSERPSSNSKRTREPVERASRNSHSLYAYNRGASRRPTLAVTVPSMWYRPTETHSNSSEEMLLNPRPRRSPHDKRQHHSKHTSQSTLRGRGAKRQRTTDTRADEQTHSSTPRRAPRTSQTQTYEESTSRRHASTRHQRSHGAADEHATSRARPGPRLYAQQYPSAPPNTGARRVPDRRFAVLAATNTALEQFRREAFAQPSPPPRRERLRRYQGMAIPASSIPFEWDCVSSHNSVGHGERSTRQRQRR